MRIRVVVADRAQVLFYDAERPESKLQLAGQLTDPEAHARDRDYRSERPGRAFDHASGAGRGGAAAYHSRGGERTPRKHEAEVFARRIVDELEQAQRQNHFDRLVLMAAPEFLGDLRKVMPKSLSQAIALEIDKDLVHADELAIRGHLPADVFVQRL